MATLEEAREHEQGWRDGLRRLERLDGLERAIKEWLEDIACLPTSVVSRLERLNCDFVNQADDVVAGMIAGSITREENLEMEVEIGASFTSEEAVSWLTAHWEMMYWNEYQDA
jgi:hypothetical protein